MSKGAKRPQSIGDFIGQDHIKDELQKFIQSAQMRNAVLDHALFYGPSGTGKTTLARIVANELDEQIVEIEGPKLNSQEQIKEIVKQVEKGSVLFIDEIHRISKNIQESFYHILEDFTVNLRTSSGHIMKKPLDEFTVVGATTELGQLETPFKDRFPRHFRLRPYNMENLAKIVNKTASQLGMDFTECASMEVAKRSRQTPRKAKRHCKKILDYVTVDNHSKVTEREVKKVFDKTGVYPYGMEYEDKMYLQTLFENDSELALRSISDKIKESMKTVKNSIEPFMVRNGWIRKKTQGRKITDKGKKVFQEIESN